MARTLYYDLGNDTDFPDGAIRSAIEEVLAKVRMPNRQFDFVFSEATGEHVPSVPYQGLPGTIVPPEQFLAHYGKFGSFTGWAYTEGRRHPDPDYRIDIVWIPTSEVNGTVSGTERVNSEHGGLPFEIESLGDSLRFVVAHEVWHCREDYRLGNHGVDKAARELPYRCCLERVGGERLSGPFLTIS